MTTNKRQMKSAARLYAVQALFQMEAASQTIEVVREEFETHRFGAEYDGDEAVSFKFFSYDFNGLACGLHLKERLHRVEARGGFHLAFVGAHAVVGPLPSLARRMSWVKPIGFSG